MNTDTARQHFTPDEPGQRLTGEEIARVQAWMVSKGYEPRDPRAHRQLARFLGYRKRRQIRRGLALVGGRGTGKTMWLRIFSRAKIYTANELVEIFKEHRQTFYEIIQPPIVGCEHDLPHGYWDLAIDEVGGERKTVNYGERCDVIAEALQLRYNIFQRYGGLTYITSNLETSEELVSTYGTRVDSRFWEMFSVVKFTCPDQRKTPAPVCNSAIHGYSKANTGD
jgi:hypothetical protein